MKNLLKILLTVFILFNGSKINSAPFDSGMITLTQPNDITFTGRIWGDEFIWWAETEDGYRFVQTFDGWFYYATLNQNGEYTPTNYKVGIDLPPASSYQLERTQARLDEIKEQIEQHNEQIELNRQWFAQKQAEADANQEPVTLQVGIVLIEFQDVKHYENETNRPNGYFTSDFENLMYSENGVWFDTTGTTPHPENEKIYGSFRDYWDQISLGKLKIEGRVANHTDQNGVPVWLTTDDSLGFYADNIHNANNWDTLADEAITKALLDSLIDTTNTYSQNYFDNIVVIYAGTAKLMGALKVVGGQRGGNWIQVAERSTWKLYWGDIPSFTHIGVYAHEFGHNLGFDDEYFNFTPFVDWGEDGSTNLFNFCLMGEGIYTGPLEKGECPATLSPYYRIRSTWVIPDTLTEDVNNFIVEYNYSNPKFYCIVPVDALEEEHYIFETRGRDGFDLYLPSNPADSVDQAGRLLIWQHNTKSDFPMANYRDRIRVIPADNDRNEDIQNQLNDFFPTVLYNNYQSFNDTTSPKYTINETHPNMNQPGDPAHFALSGIQKLANGNTLIDEVRPNYQYVTYEISGSWQTVSVPVVPSLFNYHVAAVFPTVDTNSVYKYQPPYVQVKTLENGPGYYAKFSPPAQPITFSGTHVEYLEIPVNTGWNIAGSLFYKVPVPNVCTEPPGIITGQMYFYNGGYHYLTANDSISPGIGFWVKTTSNGNIILDRFAEPCELPKITTYPQIDFTKMDKFMVSDSAGNVQTLFVSNTDIDSSIINLDMELPPFFSEIDFDSRFEYNEFVKKVSADSGLIDLNILVHTDALPVSLSWEINPENGINYSFVGDTTLGKVKEIESISGQVLFNKLNNNKIQLFAKVDGNNIKNLIPKEYNLYQNYPNPFNPSTVIEFSLPEDVANVKLSIYNALGEKVAELVNTALTAGKYQYQWNASNVATGMYIYELRTEKFNAIKKMILLK
ncbi:MAG TPA: immune inhibitor A domain-containing protein [Ignavibacteriaceae bacterium]|nr:immune inhibitor A domain-containing protein [Ignavibacteriaceae bacterium]